MTISQTQTSHLSADRHDDKKAVAYIRVSTKSDSQLHSFEFQEDYWRQAIANMQGYRLVDIYADKGISGKSVNNRKQFQNMIEAAKRGEFQTVFTKSVARFSRFTEDLLSNVRLLREIGVNVIFESENIDTSTSDSDMQLTLAAAIAEEQLRAYGSNVQWSLQDKMKKGEVVIGRMYGYKLVKGKLEIIENEAEVIRLIFNLYLSGKGKNIIARELIARGYLTLKGGKQWSDQTIGKILSNEKYAGHCEMQKSIKVGGVVIRNQQVAKRYFWENTHEPIVPQEIWDKAQKLRQERLAKITPKALIETQREYPFRSKIICSNCDKGYIHKINSPNTKWAKPMWSCITASRLGQRACSAKNIFDKTIEPLFIAAYNGFIATLGDYKGNSDILVQKEKLLTAERELRSLYTKGMLSSEQYTAENTAVLEQIKAVDKALKQASLSDIKGKNAKPITNFDPQKVQEYLDQATVQNYQIIFKFVNGYTATYSYSNGQSGNQKGWVERKKLKEQGEHNADNTK